MFARIRGMSNLYGKQWVAIYSHLKGGRLRRKRFQSQQAADRYRAAEEAKPEVRYCHQQLEVG